MEKIKSKRWCFTTWDFNKLMRIKKHLFDWIIIGEERSPSTNQIHYQGYIVSHKAYDLSNIKRLIDGKGHFEIAYGSHRDCVNYCSKENKLVIRQIGSFNDELDNWEQVFDLMR